jgi:death-on-curing protein
MAAAYLYFLTHQQGFLNGNKRTAVAAAVTFLLKNGYQLQATNWDLYQLTIHYASEDANLDRRDALQYLQSWIESRLTPTP